MNTIRRIMSGIRSLLSRFRGHPAEPQVLRPEQDYFLPPFVEDADQQPHYQTPWDRQVDEQAAVRRNFIPNQSDCQIFHIRPFPASGTMPTRAEHFIFSDDGMQRFEERTATILAGNEVASPREIGGICVCGRPIRAARIRPCHFCGVCLCPTCGRLQPLPPGLLDLPVSALVLCPAHLEEFRDQWPHWMAAGTTGEPVFLPPAMSIAILDSFQGGTP